MAVSAFIPTQEFLLRLARQEFDFLGGTIKAALLDDAYAPDMAAHAVWADVAAHECSDADYTQQTLGGKALSVDGSGRVVFDAADVSFGNPVSISARYAMLFLDGTADYLMGYFDLNDGGTGNVSSINSTFSVGFDAAGIVRLVP